jgi:isochorismate synthase
MISEIAIKTISCSQLIIMCKKLNFPFAIYRLPLSESCYFLISYNKNPVYKKIDFEDCPPGFVMAPFDTEKQLPLFFSADYNSKITLDHQVQLTEELTQKLDLEDRNSILFPFDFCLQKNNVNQDLEKESYLEKVNQLKKSILEGECQKIVLSRKIKLGNLKGENFYLGFKNLSNSYPNAFISLVNLPWKKQIWLGASPETLVHQDKEGIFTTVSIAGTQPAEDGLGNEVLTKDALWSQKEIEEQALVGRYIINCLKKIRVREYMEEGPKTIKAGNLLHLGSSYRINTKEINFPNLSSTMLDLLHPTPAVCGMPKDPATAIISKIENYDREYYSGYLGPINMDCDSHLFVNIRSMKIEDLTVFAFSGGGITADSSPEKEWLETELKLKTIEKAF